MHSSFVQCPRLLLATGLLILVLLTGCAPRRGGAPWLPGENALEPAEQIVFRERVLGQIGDLQSFRGLFRTVARRGDATSSFRQAIVFERPGRLRVEALPSQGAVALHLLTARDGQVTVVIPAEKRAIRGASSTALFRQHLDLPFREGELMALVSGRVEQAAFNTASEIRCGEKECTVRRTDGRYVWRFERASARLVSISIRDPLKLTERVRVHYARFETVDGIVVPSEITLELPEDRLGVDMHASMVKVNQPLNPALFDVAIPSDYTVSE